MSPEKRRCCAAAYVEEKCDRISRSMGPRYEHDQSSALQLQLSMPGTHEDHWGQDPCNGGIDTRGSLFPKQLLL